MENKPVTIVALQTAIEAPPPKTINDVGNAVVGDRQKKRRKKRGAMHLLRVALFILGGQSRKSKAIEVGSKGKWKQVVTSMHPLHLQNNQSPPPPLRGGGDTVPPSATVECYKDVFLSPLSPGALSSSSRTIHDDMGRYASTLNLQELDHDERSDNEKEEIEGDNMIDVKAEMFIAQFYKQAKLRRLESMHRYSSKQTTYVTNI